MDQTGDKYDPENRPTHRLYATGTGQFIRRAALGKEPEDWASEWTVFSHLLRKSGHSYVMMDNINNGMQGAVYSLPENGIRNHAGLKVGSMASFTIPDLPAGRQEPHRREV